MRSWLPLVFLLLASPLMISGAHADDATETAAPTVKELLEKMDANLVFDMRTATIAMSVDKGKRTKEYKMLSYSRGGDQAAIEFAEPVRDEGTKLLKKGTDLWMYLPNIDRTQRISGHLLRQGLMGSDFSYEDMMENNRFAETYDGEIQGVVEHEGSTCWKLELKARDPEISYPRREVLLDQATFMPLRQDLYAKSGVKLKVWTMSDIKELQGRQTAMKMTARDLVTNNSTTTLTFSDVQYSVQIADEIFSNRWLERR